MHDGKAIVGTVGMGEDDRHVVTSEDGKSTGL